MRALSSSALVDRDGREAIAQRLKTVATRLSKADADVAGSRSAVIARSMGVGGQSGAASASSMVADRSGGARAITSASKESASTGIDLVQAQIGQIAKYAVLSRLGRDDAAAADSDADMKPAAASASSPSPSPSSSSS